VISTGSVFVISAPSGAGKSTLVNALLAQDPKIVLSTSHTTRAPRGNEENGKAYFFTTEAEFIEKINRGLFLEWAQVHGNYYGTDKQLIETQLKKGFDVLLEVDWQGAEQIKKHFPHSVSIFILPPSLQILEQRLRGRGEDSAQAITRRLLAAGGEMSHVHDFDYVIVNDDLSKALDNLKAIVWASRCKLSQQRIRLHDLFSELSISDTVRDSTDNR
jgi:guanylate kinase